jgi:hypothetical protein
MTKKMPEVVVVEILQKGMWNPYHSEIDEEGDGEAKKRMDAFAKAAVTAGIVKFDEIRVTTSAFTKLRATAQQKKELFGEGDGPDE